MHVTAYTFICVECEEQLPAEKLAYDADPEHSLGVCVGCDEAIQAAGALVPEVALTLPAWLALRAA